MSEETEKDLLVASLLESVECLREELSRARTNMRILRRVHSALRSANQSLRSQIELAQQNDELFKDFCEGKFDAEVTRPVEGGLPESGTQVESQV